MEKNRIRKFKLTNKKEVKLHFKGPFIAQKRAIFIEIDEYFYKFSKEAQKAIIWHEIYHRDKVGLKHLWWLLRYGKKARWKEEFEADKYSAKMCGKSNILKALNKVKGFYKKGVVKYNSKTHPPINERIKKIIEYSKDKIGK